MTPQGQSDGFGSIGFVPVLKRWWWLLLISALIAGLCAYFITRNASPTYESKTQLLVGPINTDFDTYRAASQNSIVYASLTTSQQVIDATLAQTGLQGTLTAGELKAQTTVTADPDNRVLTIRVRTDDPAVSQRLAASLADNLIKLTSSGATARPEGQLTFTEEAAPGESVSAGSGFVIALAALAGFIGMLIVVLLIEYLRGAVRSDDELGELSGAPILGTVATSRRPAGSAKALIVETNPGSPAASAYRLVAAEIEYSRAEDEAGPRSLLVIGTERDEGAGELAANLAAALARGGRKILLVDADDASGEVTSLVGLKDVPADRPPGQRLTLAGRYRSAFTPTFELLPRGALGAIDSIDLKQVEALIERLLQSYELIVIAAAPVFDSSSTLTWSRVVDATVVSAMRERTKRNRVGDVVESLRLVNAHVIGTVLTESRFLDRFSRKRGARVRKAERQAWIAVDGGSRESVATESQAPDKQQNGPGRASGAVRAINQPRDRSGR